jgi:phosphatidylethanolamine-binding protein (PEBP) family uncharacterized protein
MNIARTVAFGCAFFAAIANAQQGQLTDVEIVGHVYEPARLSPTDARVASLQVPSGFGVHHVQVFALDTTLDLPPGFNRQARLKAMRGHVLAKG